MTSFRLRKKFGAPIGKAVLSCSLLLAGWASAVDYVQASKRLHDASGETAKRQLLSDLSMENELDWRLHDAIDDLLANESFAPTLDQVEAMVDLRAEIQSSTPLETSKNASARAKAIKESFLYRDPGEQEGSNWFAKGFQRIGQWLERLLSNRRMEVPNTPEAPNVDALGLLKVIFWGLLAVVLAAFLYFAIKHFRWRSRLERQAKALLAEDEPELSRDEYLVEADRLAAIGRHRDAVRCLYLACLLAIDEQNVARFIRGQTNWEHLRRIEASPARPADLDFVEPTRHFDVVWYGMRVRGDSDVDKMRSAYVRLLELLKRRAA